MRPKAEIRGRPPYVGQGGSYDALQSMLTGEYTEESTGARTIRQTGGKDRHSKVFTSRGPRDRRVRLSVATAIRFYDLQDRLGFEQPSKAVEWLLLHCQPSIKALPQIGTLHRPQVRVAALSAAQSAHLSDHSPPHVQAMDVKSSCENITRYKTMHNHRFGQETPHDHRALLAALQHNERAQACFKNGSSNCLDTHSFYVDTHAGESIEEDPPQFSNPSSSGASSDHPTSLSNKASEAHPHRFEPASSTQSMLHPESNFKSTPFLCESKRSMQCSPCFSKADQHAQADNYQAGFTSEGNVGGNRMMQEDNQRSGLDISQRLFGTDNMADPYDHCPVINSNTGRMYGNLMPAGNYSLIGNNMNMGTNASLGNIRQNDFFMDINALQATPTDPALQQMMQLRAASAAEPNNIAALEQFRAGINGLANESMMPLQVVGHGDSSFSANMEETIQNIYGKMGMCGAMDHHVSPSESNNNNNNNNMDQYRPSFEWTLKHALL